MIADYARSCPQCGKYVSHPFVQRLVPGVDAPKKFEVGYRCRDCDHTWYVVA